MQIKNSTTNLHPPLFNILNTKDTKEFYFPNWIFGRNEFLVRARHWKLDWSRGRRAVRARYFLDLSVLASIRGLLTRGEGVGAHARNGTAWHGWKRGRGSMEDPRGPRPPEALLLVPCAAAARIGATRHATISWMPGRLLATTDPLNETPLHELARLTSPHARGTRLLSTAIPLFLPSFGCDAINRVLLSSTFLPRSFHLFRSREKNCITIGGRWAGRALGLFSTIRNVYRKVSGRVSFKLAVKGNSKNFEWQKKNMLDLECLQKVVG